MGNFFPSFGHAGHYLRQYITRPLRELVTVPPPPPPAIPVDPHTAQPPPQHSGTADADRHRTAHSNDSRRLQRETLARVETDAATHIGSQGVLDDEAGDGSEQHNRHVHLDTAPPDPRFAGRPDQSYYCWALYNSYLRCIDSRSVLDEHCLFLKKCSVAMCPCDLIAEWTADRKAGRWYGVPVPYHKVGTGIRMQQQTAASQSHNNGWRLSFYLSRTVLLCVQGEMDLGELEEELETEDEEDKADEEHKAEEEIKVVEQSNQQQLAPSQQPTSNVQNSLPEDDTDTAKQAHDRRVQQRAERVKDGGGKVIEERLVEPAEPVEDVTRVGEPVVERADEVVKVAPERLDGVSGAGVEPLPEGVDDLRERQKREALRLWEEQQQAQHNKEAAQRQAADEHSREYKLEIKKLIRHALTAIHK